MTVDFLGPAKPDPFLFKIVTMIGFSFAGNENNHIGGQKRL